MVFFCCFFLLLLFFAEVSRSKCNCLTLCSSTSSHFLSSQVALEWSSFGVPLTLPFHTGSLLPPCYCSRYLKPLSCSASSSTHLLLSSLLLINIHLGFCATEFPAFHPTYLTPLRRVPSSVFPRLLSCVCSLAQQSPLLPRDDPGGRGLIFFPTQSIPLSPRPAYASGRLHK